MPVKDVLSACENEIFTHFFPHVIPRSSFVQHLFNVRYGIMILLRIIEPLSELRSAFHFPVKYLRERFSTVKMLNDEFNVVFALGMNIAIFEAFNKPFSITPLAICFGRRNLFIFESETFKSLHLANVAFSF